ncbi:hypothetical protein [Phormidium sp. CCY1219]|uniref:hypothetical protein n=1 Tax=Phormidium sp. CCY1219 TaxID=2886104 RepID=UPI002D1F1829|nr:hypothetical protein [Phormidium sp. CCY1219]MEB3828223.1 hypothetical protein [Phormidium sp. CCY1219]
MGLVSTESLTEQRFSQTKGWGNAQRSPFYRDAIQRRVQLQRRTALKAQKSRWLPNISTEIGDD